jgi:hypothetical protein
LTILSNLLQQIRVNDGIGLSQRIKPGEVVSLLQLPVLSTILKLAILSIPIVFMWVGSLLGQR